MTTPKYESSDIKVLSDREHCRLRFSVYFGSNELTEFILPDFVNNISLKRFSFSPAAYRAMCEIFDNAVDEFNHLPNSWAKKLTIEYSPTTGETTVSDTGRGVPIDLHETGKPTPEVVFTTLRSGRNFDDAAKHVGTIGTNGVGSSATNFCSEFFHIDVWRNKKHYSQKCFDGAADIRTPKIVPYGKTDTGTSIKFKLDAKVFSGRQLIPESIVQNNAISIAMCNPGITVIYINTDTDTKHTYKFKKFSDAFTSMESFSDFHAFEGKSDQAVVEGYVFFNQENPTKISWVNGSLVLLGSMAITQFENAFSAMVSDELETAANKNKVKISSADIGEGLSYFVNVRVRNPAYDSQAKTRMVGPSVRDEFKTSLDEEWKTFKKNHGEWIESVLERAISRQAYKQTKDDLKAGKKKRVKAENLIDATSHIRSLYHLFVTEGLSAHSNIGHVRDPEFIGAYPLTGKINNVYGMKSHQIAALPKVSELLKVCGLIPGHKLDPEILRYGKIIIATDADHDGGDIFTLLVNLFFQHWPELFDKKYPRVFRLLSPNVCVVKGDERIHFAKASQFEKVKSKYEKGCEVKYFKGLGSLSVADWRQTLANPECFYPIVDEGNMKSTLQLLFSDNAAARKVWLQGEKE